MSRTRKIWLGIFTFLPLVFLMAYFVVFFMFFVDVFNTIEIAETNQDMQPSLVAGGIKSFLFMMLPLIFLTVITSIGIMIYYIVHANKNPDNDNNKKIMWTFILIFVSTIGSIVYYFVEILPTNKEIDNKVH